MQYHASPTCTKGHHTGQGTIEGVQKTPGLQHKLDYTTDHINPLLTLAKRNLLMKRTARPPVEAPRMVFTMARATTLPSSGPEMLPFRGPYIMSLGIIS